MHGGLDLDLQSQILVADGWKRRNVAKVAEYLRDLRRVVDRGVAGILNRIAGPEMEGRISALSGTHRHIFQTANPRFVERELRAQLVETESHERQSAAECGERLAEDGILLASQL